MFLINYVCPMQQSSLGSKVEANMLLILLYM